MPPLAISRFFGGTYLTSANPQHTDVLFGIAAFVFILGLFALGVIQGLILLARRVEKSRSLRGQGSGGFMAAMHSDFEKPGVRARLRILWIVVGVAGLVALIALFV